MRRRIVCATTLAAMAGGRNAAQLAAEAVEAIRQVLSEAEEKAAELLREAESQAAKIREKAEADALQARERAEADARAQIDAAKRALDELGGTLAAAASAAVPKAEAEPEETKAEKKPAEGLEPDTSPEPAVAPEAPVSAPHADGATEEATTGASGEAAERLMAMKLAVDGKDPAAIEAELIEKFGPGDRTELLKEVLERVTR